MSPEQALDSHTADTRADVYSLGATLYFLLAGHSPFAGRTTTEKVLWLQTRLPRPIRELRPEVPAGLAAVLERMMAKDPAQRYPTPAAVAEALAPWAQAGATPWPPVIEPAPWSGDTQLLDSSATLPTRSYPPAGPPNRGRRGWMLAVGLAAVLLAAGAAVLALQRGGYFDGSGGQRDPGRKVAGGEASGPRLRLLVPAYFYPGGEGAAEWERLLKAPDPATITIIVNQDNGPGKAADPNFTRVIEHARERRFTVIGYVRTDYGKRPAGDVKADVDRWVSLYPGVQGVFFDEQATKADRLNYYAGLYEYARKERGLSPVIGNPGAECVEGYLRQPAADAVCLVESNKEFALFRPPAWAADYQPRRFAALLHHVSGERRMRRYVEMMAEKRIGYGYVTDGDLPNPWGRLPAYWEAELAAVRQVNAPKGP